MINGSNSAGLFDILKSTSFGMFFETPFPNNASTECDIFSNLSMVFENYFVNISRMEKMIQKV